MRHFFIFFQLFLFSSSLSIYGQNAVAEKPVKVEIKQIDHQSRFFVNGKKFEIKGVGLNYADGHNFELLHKIGGNSFRTWGTKNASEELEAAKKYGFMVALGLSVGKELYGFDYNDQVAVAAQFEKIKKEIRSYKSHPNVLCWVLGNELNLLFEKDGKTLKPVNEKAYDAMCDIIDFIHTEDPNHPVTIPFAGVIDKDLQTTLKNCPNIDFVSVQVYGALETVEADMKRTGITKPYLITETGPKGFWEMPYTSWDREIEEASGPKTDGISSRIQKGIVENKSGKCLGAFIFEWGQKQERTPTWYGMFQKDGSQTETIDLLQYLWTGSYPETRAPRVERLVLNGKTASENVILNPNQKYDAEAFVTVKDVLSYKWEIRKETIIRSQGGELEVEPPLVAVELSGNADRIHFQTSEQEGEYRLFVYVYNGTDENKKVGYANIPFYVKKNKNE